MTSCSQPQMPPHAGTVRSVPFAEWPEADRFASTTARRPAERLKRGGAASHMKDITFRDLARRYGYFLDYVQRTEGLDLSAAAAAYVTPDRVNAFVAELQELFGKDPQISARLSDPEQQTTLPRWGLSPA